MQIEVGKSYRTRGGFQACVTHSHFNPWTEFRALCGTVNGDGGFDWSRDGRFMSNETALDIVAPWENEKPAPKFAVGSEWRTRGGWRAIIVNVNEDDGNLIVWHKKHLETRGHWPNGVHCVSAPEPEDLIEPWSEPTRVRVKAFLNVYDSGPNATKVILYASRRNADIDYQRTIGTRRIACIEIDREVVEGEGIETPARA